MWNSSKMAAMMAMGSTQDAGKRQRKVWPPDSSLRHRWNMVNLLVTLFNCLAVPYRVAFAGASCAVTLAVALAVRLRPPPGTTVPPPELRRELDVRLLRVVA